MFTTTVDQNNREGVVKTAGRVLGISVGFIIMVPVLYSSKYVYSIQTDTNLMSIYSIDCNDCKLQEPHLLPSAIINFLTLL